MSRPAHALLTAASGFALAMAFAGSAFSQAAPPAAAKEGEVEEVVVTGSRIVRNDYNAESPVVTVGQAQIQNTGTPALDQTLNQLPQFNASATGQAQGGGTGPSRAAGRATVNLRGLGTARTLVLLDGRRLQPSDPLGSVDLNTISAALVENVEVITGGASAVYGSDAVAGVVNFKLKRNFTGVQLDADYGLTERGDGQTTSLALTMGGRFDDGRGSMAMSLGYFNRQGILRQDVPFFDDIGGTCCFSTGLVTQSGSNLWTNAALQSVFRQYGTAVPPISGAIAVNRDGTLFGTTPAINLRYTAADGFFVAPSGQVQQRLNPGADPSTVLQPLDRYTAFARGEYELTDHVKLFGHLNYATYEATSRASGLLQATQSPLQVRYDNPFVPAALRTLLASRPNPTAPFTYYFTASRITPQEFRTSYDVAQFLAGLSGDVPNVDWTWEVYGAVGTSKQSDNYTGYISRSRFLTLANAADGGQSICTGGYPLFGYGPISAACSQYLMRPVHSESEFQQRVVEANLQGGLFQLPAGELRFATGAAYRYNNYDYRPDEGLVTLEALGTSGTNPSGGSTDVYELYGELLIPVVKDLAFVQELNVDLAYRFSKYDTVGGVHTYKASADWEIVDGLRARGGYSRAIRAPSVGELFAARSAVSANILSTVNGGGDPCDIRSAVRRASPSQVRALCLGTGVPAGVIDTITFGGAAVAGFQTGNTALEEEVADSYTVGLVYNPRIDWAPLSRVQVSLDYYDIQLEGAIANIASLTSLQRCFNADSASNPTYDPTNVFCRNITRDSSGQLANVAEPAANLGGYHTSGLDFQLDWLLQAADFGWSEDLGSLALNLVLSYVDAYEIQTLPGAAFLNYGGTIGNGTIDPLSISHPRWKHAFNATYSRGPAQLTFRWRSVDAMDNAANVGTGRQLSPGIDPVHYFDLSGRYRIDANLELRAGVVNLTDRAPPVWTGQAGVDSATYDLQGRRYFVGVTKRF
jgi:outer membrane receptor protein involved in Fe transport